MTDIDCLGGRASHDLVYRSIYLFVLGWGGGEKGMELVDESATANFYF